MDVDDSDLERLAHKQIAPCPAAGVAAAVVVRSALTHGVWHVARWRVRGRLPIRVRARQAASDVAREIERKGRRANILFAEL